MVRLGVVGLGYWGPNLTRSFASLPGVKLTAICDLDGERLNRVHTQFPTLYATRHVDELLDAHPLDALVIATPIKSHYPLARKALERGLHTFVEKPLATSPQECEVLVRLSEAKGVVLFVGHTFLYSPAVAKLKDLIVGGELGRLCYMSSTRVNLGRVQPDVSALWDLASHDVSIILYLMGTSPMSVNCQGLAFLNGTVHEVCSLTLRFQDKSMATVHVSWLHPKKTRELTIIGDKKMAVYDDTEPLEKVKIYDMGIERAPSGPADSQYTYRYGDTYSPRLVDVEPLLLECRHFIECIREGRRPKTDGRNGLEAVRILHAAEQSLFDGGGRVCVSPEVRDCETPNAQTAAAEAEA
jgi:predicted dehydrogenase